MVRHRPVLGANHPAALDLTSGSTVKRGMTTVSKSDGQPRRGYLVGRIGWLRLMVFIVVMDVRVCRCGRAASTSM